jgi:hypothetical protein
MFCDSFGMSCGDLLSLFFREIFIVRSPYFHSDTVREFGPTHVISSNVERYLPNFPTDREAPIALLMPQLLNKQVAPDQGFYNAVNAQLRPRSLVYTRFYQQFMT